MHLTLLDDGNVGVCGLSQISDISSSTPPVKRFRASDDLGPFNNERIVSRDIANALCWVDQPVNFHCDYKERSIRPSALHVARSPWVSSAARTRPSRRSCRPRPARYGRRARCASRRSWVLRAYRRSGCVGPAVPWWAFPPASWRSPTRWWARRH